VSEEFLEPRRTAAYQKDPAQEDFFRLLNAGLRQLELGAAAAPSAPSQPILFVIGVQRSGTTLIMQLLGRALRLCYPDNIAARFWGRPEVGIALSAALREQLGGGFRERPLVSDYGVTQSPFEPHELGYFWERHFDLSGSHDLSGSLAEHDPAPFQAELAAMEQRGWGPLLFKAVAMGFNAAYLARILPTSRFLYITREPLYVVQSTFQARVRRYGSAEHWWSLRPADYEELQLLPPLEQIVAQVQRSRRAIERELDQIEAARVFRLRYEDLCADPAAALSHVAGWLPAEREPAYDVPAQLNCGNVARLEAGLLERARELLVERA